MNLAIITPTYLPARRANTIQVMKMSQALARLGHQVRVVAPAHTSEFSEIQSQTAWDDLAEFYGLQFSFPVEWLPAYPGLKRYDFGFRAVLWARHWGAQVIYTRLPQAAAFASWLGMRTIYEVHDLPSGYFGSFLFRVFIRYGGARRLVVISQALLDDLERLFDLPQTPSFTIVAADGVDLERYEKLPAPPKARRELREKKGVPLEVGCFTAGYSGHLYSGRGIELILTIAKKQPEVTFLIVGGEPNEVMRIRDQVNHRMLRNVVVTGFVSNAQLPLYQAACEVLLMPYQRKVAASSGGDISRYLSPMKMFEYMACGRVILASDLPVLREVLSPNNARLLPPEDETAWVEALQDLRQNPISGDALADQARRDAKEYSWEARAERVLAGI